MTRRLAILLLFAARLAAFAVPQDDDMPSPFLVNAHLKSADDRTTVLHVEFKFPHDCVIYADHLRFVAPGGAAIEPLDLPAPITDIDKASGEERQMFDRPFGVDLPLGTNFAGEILVRLQGCSNNICFFPEKHFFAVSPAGVKLVESPALAAPVQVSKKPDATSANWPAEAARFHIVSRQTGYIRAPDFIAFLRRSTTIAGEPPPDFFAPLRSAALWLLPALIAALAATVGLRRGKFTRKPNPLLAYWHRGGWQRAVSAAAMALIYGLLGLTVVLTGVKFGVLHASAWVNAGIAGAFFTLALALFGGLQLDFFRPGDGDWRGHRGRSFLTILAGAAVALLAGACIAPVVVSVLLLAAELHTRGNALGLALPFLLGAGLALPWPFAEPAVATTGRWPQRIFGTLLLCGGMYFAGTAVGLARPANPATDLATAPGGGLAVVGANQSLTRALKQARAQGRHVLLDVRASWCKNCLAMESSVFTKEDVRRELGDFIVVKYQAERPNESPAKEVLDYFGVVGLPTYVVLMPNK